MAETGTEIKIFREWAPLSELLNKIPTKAQHGIFNYDIKLTCVDILPQYIALGTNLGLVYWYDRYKKNLQRLRCENSGSGITEIKVVSTVDYMVACGNSNGQITIFQIPKSHPDSIPDCIKPKTKQVERYTVSDIHSGSISSLEWSKNGMKLFSGDKNGLVVLTEIDFYMHLSKSIEVLNETYEIVQLSYNQQFLLVSTTYRSIICQKLDKWKVCQVGKKDRKILGKFGAVLWRNSLKPKDLLIYSTRPGLRIWISDLEGTVQQTLLFKDLLNNECFEVPLINPISGQAKKLRPAKEATFGILLPFANNFLVTHSSENIYVLDPINFLVIATISHLRRIVSVATSKDEIFILEGDRSLIRVSFTPEPDVNCEQSNSIPIVSTFLPIANSIKDLTHKLQTSSIISALPPLFESSWSHDCSVHTDSTSVISAEEAVELPLVKKLPYQVSLKIAEAKILDQNPNIKYGQECKDTLQEIKNEIDCFSKIASREYDDQILFKHHRRKRHKNGDTDMTASVTSISSTSSEEHDSHINRPCVLDVSTIGPILPDLRSPESILKDIENKEKMLADLLNLDAINFSSFENDTSEFQNDEKAEKSTNASEDLTTEQNESDGLDSLDKKQYLNNYVPTVQNYKNDIKIHNKNFGTCNGVTDGIVKNSDVSNNYGPPSSSESFNPVEPPVCLMVPEMWKLQEIQVNSDLNEASDNSLCDWEII